MNMLDDDTYLATVREATRRLAAIPADRLDHPVPACPGWTVADLQAHLGQVHRWCAALLAAPPGVRVPYGEADQPAHSDELATWLITGAEQVTTALADDDRDREVGTFIGRRPSAWWARRLAHESTIHAWDGDAATGTPAPIPAALAVDGVDELFETYVLRRFATDRFGGQGETLHLHATDADGEWLVRFEPDGVVVTREHAKGDVAARGRAGDLLLFLWSRTDASALEVFGDAGILERWQAAATY